MPEFAAQQLSDTPKRVDLLPVRDGFAGRRFTFVLAWATFGGAEQQALTLARHLRGQGAVVDVCALTTQDGEARARFEEEGIPWRPLSLEWPTGRPAKAGALLSFAARLRHLRPDVLMPFCTRPNVLCGLVWRVAGASTCIWHQQDVNPVTRFSPGLLRYAARSTPLLVSNSQHGVEHLVSVVGAPPDRVHYAPHGVELAEAKEGRPAWRGQLGAASADFVVCMLANLREGKDYSTLLRAWRTVVDRLAEDDRRGLLVFAGGGPALAEAKAQAFDLDLRPAVRFLGFVRDVGGLLRASDVGVLATYREGCPTALLECMAARLAVAGSNIPGIREAVGPDGYAYLAEPGDPTQLAAVLMRLADDPHSRRVLGKQNAARVARVFSTARMLEVHMGLLQQVVRRS